MICFKFSRKIRKLFHKNERFGAILLTCRVKSFDLTRLSSFLMKVYRREAKFGVYIITRICLLDLQVAVEGEGRMVIAIG